VESQFPDEPSREDLIRVVAWMLEGDRSEADVDRAHAYLDRHLPDPAWSDIIYWPNLHAVASQRGVTEPTPTDVVDIAFEYRPIAL
jgi:hypothetical protein